MNLVVNCRSVKSSYFYAQTENSEWVIVAFGEPIALALSDGRVILRLKLTSGGIHQRILATLEEIRRITQQPYTEILEVDETNWAYFERLAARRPIEYVLSVPLPQFRPLAEVKQLWSRVEPLSAPEQ